jgi:hypothetical protein
MNCFGTYTFANGDKYVGEFKDDKRNGQGTYTYTNGNKYVGEYRDDKRSGQGTETFAKSGSKYVGEYKDSKWHGQGTYTFTNGNKYVGEFRDGNFHGQGTFTFASGSKYVGEFRDDKRNGQGTYTFANGKIQKGMFENGKFVGKGFAHAKSIDSIDSSKFKPGIKYINYTDSSCRNYKKEVCVNNIDYEYLCNNAKSITEHARGVTASAYRSAFGNFIRGGNFGSLKINFRAPKYCAVSFVISGVFKGSSTRKVISGRGSTFIVTKSGKILFHNVSTF